MGIKYQHCISDFAKWGQIFEMKKQIVDPLCKNVKCAQTRILCNLVCHRLPPKNTLLF